MVARRGMLLGAGCFNAGIAQHDIVKHNESVIKDGSATLSGTWTLYHGPCEENECGWFRSVYSRDVREY